MIPIKDVIQMAADSGAELGAMDGMEFAIVMTPDQLYTVCHLIFEMGKVTPNVELAVERMRLAACGVVALVNTEESAMDAVASKTTLETDVRLEELSDKIRKGEPVGMLGAIAAINYQETLRAERKRNTLWARFVRWLTGMRW